MWWPFAASTIKTMPKTAIEPTRMGTTKQEAAIWDEATSNDETDTASDCALPRDAAETGLQAHAGAAHTQGQHMNRTRAGGRAGGEMSVWAIRREPFQRVRRSSLGSPCLHCKLSSRRLKRSSGTTCYRRANRI